MQCCTTTFPLLLLFFLYLSKYIKGAPKGCNLNTKEKDLHEEQPKIKLTLELHQNKKNWFKDGSNQLSKISEAKGKATRKPRGVEHFDF